MTLVIFATDDFTQALQARAAYDELCWWRSTAYNSAMAQIVQEMGEEVDDQIGAFTAMCRATQHLHDFDRSFLQ